MTPFLEKLRELCANCGEDFAGWSKEGAEFEVREPQAFEQFLKQYFKGTLKTFVRQLHFYGFKKSEVVNGLWSFSHPKFHRDNPDGVLEITRKTRIHPISFASKDEVKVLRKELEQVKKSFKTEMQSMRKKMGCMMDLIKQQEKKHKNTVQDELGSGIKEESLDLKHPQRRESIPKVITMDENYSGLDKLFASEASTSTCSTPPPELFPELFNLFPMCPPSNSSSSVGVGDQARKRRFEPVTSSSSVSGLKGHAHAEAKHFQKKTKVPPANKRLEVNEETTKQSSIFRFEDYPMPIQDLSFNSKSKSNW